MSRGRGAPLANLGPNSFAYAIIIFWPAGTSWYKWYHGTYGRERNLLAIPTLDIFLPLSKFESIQRVSLTLRCNNSSL